MRVNVYVDGFNVYYRALRGKSYSCKWLDYHALAKRILDPSDTVQLIRYFTARITPRAGDPDAPRRQQIYFSALRTLPNLTFHYGRFLSKKKMRPLVSTGRFVEVWDTEEKGSDVNLAVHMLNDGWCGDYDVALVLSQDTDLIEPLRIVSQDLGKIVGLAWLDGGRPNKHLAAASTFVRHVRPSDLVAAQFPNPIRRNPESPIYKPETW